MNTIVKQVVGIDVAQKELVVCLGRMYDDWTPELYAHRVFSNTSKGFADLQDWVKQQSNAVIAPVYVMEATGVYHERLAYYLAEHSLPVVIVLPNKISNYVRTLDVKTVTDKTSSEAIARFGLERQLQYWQPPSESYRKMRQLSRERNQVVEERTVAKNQLHAELSEALPNKKTIARIKQRIALFDKQERAIKSELALLIKGDATLTEQVEIICSLPGVGLLTAATVLAETNGFELIRNKRQLASYAGYDVKQKQSGSSVKGKPHISKRGNKYLRKAMHLPALSAIRSDERFKSIFARLVSKHGIKMKAAVAVQRKLLEMIYIMAVKKIKYNKDYFKTIEQQQRQLT